MFDLGPVSCGSNILLHYLQKNGHSYISAESPDIFCVQETKCEKEKLPKSIEIDGYHTYWLSGDKEGYSGTGLYSKIKPINVTYGLGMIEP
jgi:AP endonuclease-1